MPFYHIVIADARAPRDGRFIEKIGIYNPLTKPATIDIDREKAYDWLQKGAQPTDTVRAILRYKGVYYLKHVMVGAKKGVFSEEVAMEKFNEYLEKKESKIAARREKTLSEIKATNLKIAGLEADSAVKVVPKVTAKAAPPTEPEAKPEVEAKQEEE